MTYGEHLQKSVTRWSPWGKRRRRRHTYFWKSIFIPRSPRRLQTLKTI